MAPSTNSAKGIIFPGTLAALFPGSKKLWGRQGEQTPHALGSCVESQTVDFTEVERRLWLPVMEDEKGMGEGWPMFSKPWVGWGKKPWWAIAQCIDQATWYYAPQFKKIKEGFEYFTTRNENIWERYDFNYFNTIQCPYVLKHEMAPHKYI